MVFGASQLPIARPATLVQIPRMNTRPAQLPSSIEPLENRIAPAVVVTVADITGDGSTDLRISGGSGREIVSIDSTGATTILSIDANGDGDFTDPNDTNADDLGLQPETYDIRLNSGNDRLTIAFGALNNAERSLFINLGAGSNAFTLTTGTISNGSDIRVDVQGSPSNDALTIGFGSVFDSRLSVTGNLYGGRDALLDAAGNIIGPSVLSFPNNGDFSGSTVSVDLDLGTGSNLFRFNVTGDVDLNATDRSTVEFNVTGSPLAKDSDDISFNFAESSVNTGSFLRVHAALLAGHDRFTASVPNGVRVDNTAGETAGGYFLLDVDGGAGNDTLSVTRGALAGTMTLDGLWDINLRGGAGDDTLSVETQTLITDNIGADLRGLRLNLDGGDGKDSLIAALGMNATATFNIDAALRGGFGDDFIALIGNDNGGAPTFGPSGEILVDGGAGANGALIFSDLTVHQVNINSAPLTGLPGVTSGDFDGNGSTDVRIIGNAKKNIVEIADSGTSMTVSLDLNGDGDFTDPGEADNLVIAASVESIFIDLGAGADDVDYTATALNNRDRHIALALGDGRNSFIATTSSISAGSDFSIEILGGKSNDSIDILTGNIATARALFAASLLGGRDGLTNAAGAIIAPSQVQFSDNGDITNSSVRVDFDLGTGGNFFAARVTSDLSAPGVTDVHITGSDGATDKDNVTIDLENASAVASAILNAHVDLLGGNDFALITAPLTNAFRLTNGQTGGNMFFSVSGGAGADSLTFTGGTDSNPGLNQLDGLLEVFLRGGIGNDKLSFDLAGNFDGMETDTGTAVLRGLHLFMTGGHGNDTIAAIVAASVTATFRFDILLAGGFGNDKLIFDYTNNGAVTFGPAGNILLEGGIGADTLTQQITGPIQVQT